MAVNATIRVCSVNPHTEGHVNGGQYDQLGKRSAASAPKIPIVASDSPQSRFGLSAYTSMRSSQMLHECKGHQFGSKTPAWYIITSREASMASGMAAMTSCMVRRGLPHAVPLGRRRYAAHRTPIRTTEHAR